MGSKRVAEYKQMSFDTAIRNPERYREILEILVRFENIRLTDENILSIVIDLYKEGVVASKEINLSEDINQEEIKLKVIEVNKTRKADGGYPEGYQSRFWTYVRTLSELGFVYAQYNETFKISKIAQKLVDGEIDESEAFSTVSFLCNRRSPYRNVCNDYNYFRFIFKVLLKLHEKGKSLTFYQFIVSTFDKKGDADDFISIINSKRFYDYECVISYLKGEMPKLNKIQTVMRDYPDVVLRLLRITGFITIKSTNMLTISLTESKLELLKKLLSIPIALSDEEKIEPILYYGKINGLHDQYLSIIKSNRTKMIQDGYEYKQMLKKIVKTYQLDEDKVSFFIYKIGKSKLPQDFTYIPIPLQLEFFVSLLIFLKYGKDYGIKPNYKMDSYGLPISHAPGNKGDIEVYSKTVYWLIEVTMIKSLKQQTNQETTSVIRHLIQTHDFAKYSKKYLSFIAPIVHDDTWDWYNYQIHKNNKTKIELFIKAYSINDFVNITINTENFQDMEKYTNSIING